MYSHQAGEEESKDLNPPLSDEGVEVVLTNPTSAKQLQMIESASELIRELGHCAHVHTPDELIAEVEGLLALLITVQGCVDYVAVSAAIFLYVRRFFDKSISKQVVRYITEILDPLVPQAGEESLSEPSPGWLDLIRDARSNWTLCKGNKLFDHFSKLLGLLVTLGLCKASQVTFSIRDYKIFEPDMKIIHGSAVDIADAALSTVTFFVESMYSSFKTGSLRPFLISDQAAAELDEEYTTIVLWWDLVKTGNLERVAKKSEKEFDARLETLCTKLRNLMSGKVSFEKKLIQDKFMRLLGIKNDYITMKISSGVRKAPFAIELCGESSQGKTTCGDQFVDAMLTSAGLPTGKEYRSSYNAGDKFMSNWSTNKEVMFIDDLANEKASFVERPPTRVIIDVCNNQPFYANMAELDKKGKVFVEPSIVVVNTNIKDLDARLYSNCPYSIQRRMHAVITVKAKIEFQFILDGKPQGIDSSKIRAKFGKDKPLFDDIWELTVEKAVQPETLRGNASYKPVVWRGQELVGVPYRLVMQYVIEKFHDHRADQDDILDRMKSRTTDIHVCGVNGCKQIAGYCDLHPQPYTRQFGEEIFKSAATATKLVSDRFRSDMTTADRLIEGATSMALLGSARLFANHWDWVFIIPTPWLLNPRVQDLFMVYKRDTLRQHYIWRSLQMWLGVMLLVWPAYRYATQRSAAFVFIVFILALLRQKLMITLVKQRFCKELLDRNTIHPMLKDWRDRHAGSICKAIGIVGALYAIARLYRRWKSMKEQGSLEPKNIVEVNIRDGEVSPWTAVTTASLPMTVTSKCIAPTELMGVVSKNLVYGTVVAGDKILMVNGLFLRSNAVIVPDHYFYDDDLLDVTFRKENPNKSGGKFATRLSINSSYKFPNSDLRLCYSPSCGSFKDLTKWFPTDKLTTHQFSLMHRLKDGELVTAQGLAKVGIASNGTCDFLGGTYSNLSIDTFKGLCGAVLVSHGGGSCITGIHLGGHTGTPKGCFGTLLCSDLELGCAALRKYEGVLLTGTAENFERQVLGIKILTGRELHPKSPLNYMPPSSQVEYYGSCGGQTTYRSNVKVTKMSEHVMDVLDVPNSWGPPKMQPDWFGWQKCLSNLSIPALPYSHELLTVCVLDYKVDMMPIFESPLWNSARPLTDHENLCGIPGKKFMDAIKLDTSVGFPLSGPKRKFITELEPTPDKPNNRVLDQVILDEIDRCEQEWTKGYRAYTIAKACKKDEVLSTLKEKCRIFYGNPIALTWCIRKYFLPILRVMQMNPLTSECAVGINSHGPEWEQFHQHVLTFGTDTIIGGDYGKYDQKLPSQLIIASFRIMIDFARVCDYKQVDLDVMEALAGDVAYSLIAYNGDLIGLTEGTHISGNSLTVVINGICGSLNLRACFYSLYPTTMFMPHMPFRKYVKAMTYGDDNIGSVSPKVPKFTIKAVSEFLAEYGQTYTMPDKESELVDYLPLKDFEFLKRVSVYHPSLGVHTGALVEKSIHKMLHCYMRPRKCPITEELACALNIDTSLSEWFNHGSEIYEARRISMSEVARLTGVTHLCTSLDTTYDERVKSWKDKYRPEP